MPPKLPWFSVKEYVLYEHFNDVIWPSYSWHLKSLVSTVCSIIASAIHQRKEQSSALLALCEWNPLVTGHGKLVYIACMFLGGGGGGGVHWWSPLRLAMHQMTSHYLRRQVMWSTMPWGILGRELGPSGVSPNQRSRWKHAFSPLRHV